MKDSFYTKVLILLCIIMISPACNVFSQTTDDGKLLFVIAGQSNAVGQGDSTQSISCEGLPCYEYDAVKDAVKPLKDPVGQKWRLLERAGTGSVGPSFAKRMYELTHKSIYIVATARGGASCHRNAWMPPYNTWDERGGMFDDATAKIDNAIKSCGSPVSGIIWMQGERDANAILDKQLTPSDYKQALKSVIIRFRKKYGKEIPFYIVMTGLQKNRPHDGCIAVRTVQSEVCREMNKVFIVYDTKPLSENEGWYKDIVHYNQKALNVIGKEVAEKVIGFSTSKSLTGDILNRYGWHLRVGDSGEYYLADERKISDILDIATRDSALVPYHYEPTNVKEEDYKHCKTIHSVYKKYDKYELPIEMDIPEGKGPFPFVIYIHGGGWGGGNLKVYEQHSKYLASKGIAGIRISYSLIKNGGTFQKVEEEISEAIAYTFKQSKKLHLDTLRWGIMGASAGAHLGSIAALKTKGCKMFVGFYGAYDLLKSRDDNFPSKELCMRYLGNTDEKSLMKASAIYQIPSKDIPKIFLLHGTADLTINWEQSRLFANKLKEKGADVKELYYDGYGHSFTANYVTDLYERILDELYNYAKNCFEK
jgi:acetyl esterase/lipase